VGLQHSDRNEPASGGSGLRNLGGGNWQYNGKLDKASAGMCRVDVLNLQGGDSTHTTRFQIN
jgi:hypothetical protein